MKLTIFISLLLVFLGQLITVNGAQLALRSRSKEQLLSRSISLSRSIASNDAIFDPTNEESFYLVGDDPNTVVKTIHQASKRKYVNFEKFEDYLRPQERLCTPSPDEQTTLLSFPLNSAHYSAARERWAGEEGFVFIGHDPSCFAPEEERSSFKSLSIVFDDALETIWVTGKPLHFGDRHFPAPAELIIGRAPGNVVLTRRMTNERDVSQDLGDDLECMIKDPVECVQEEIAKISLDIDSPDRHINFTSKEHESRKKYWPPDELTKVTGVPELFELYCLECRTTGGLDQELHIMFNPVNDSDDKDDDDHHHSRRNAEDDGDFRQMFKDHVKRAFVKYTVTDEIKIRKQIEIVSPVAADVYCNVPLVATSPPGAMTCTSAYTAGGLQWEPSMAKEDKKSRAKAMGPKEVGDPKAGSGKTNAWGYSVWPMDYGIYIWMNFGISTKVKMTLPGFEATVPVGSELEVDLMGKDKGKPIDSTKFDPFIELLPTNLSIESSDFHFNIAVGPKAGLNIGLPQGKLGIGIGVRFDVVRIDNKWSEYKNVTIACTEPKEDDEAFENAFGFTMDLKTGIYAYLNLLGFYIDTSWISNKVGSDFSGLYWGIKNLIANCGDCGEEPCVSQAVNKLLGVASDGHDFVDGNYSVSNLTDSEHAGKDSILSLDNEMVGEDMPTGNPDVSCYARAAPKLSRRKVSEDDEDEDEDENEDDKGKDANVCAEKKGG